MADFNEEDLRELLENLREHSEVTVEQLSDMARAGRLTTGTFRDITGELSSFKKMINIGQNALGDFGDTVASTMASIGRGNTELTQLTGVVQSLGNGLADLVGMVPIFGDTLSAAVKGLTAVLSYGMEQSTMLYSSFNELSKTGLMGSEGIKDMGEKLKETGIPLKNLTKMLTSNSDAMAMFGDNANLGANSFINLMGDMRKGMEDEMKILGLNTEEIGEYMIDFQKRSIYLGSQQTFGSLEMQKSAKAYATQLAVLSNLTGEEIGSLKKKQMKDLENSSYFASMRQIRKKSVVKDGKNGADRMAQLISMLESSGAKDLAAGMKALASGAVVGESGKKMVTMTGDAGFKARHDIIDATRNVEDIANELIQIAGKKTESLETSAQFMGGSNYDKMFINMKEMTDSLAKAKNFTPANFAKAFSDVLAQQAKVKKENVGGTQEALLMKASQKLEKTSALITAGFTQGTVAADVMYSAASVMEFTAAKFSAAIGNLDTLITDAFSDKQKSTLDKVVDVLPDVAKDSGSWLGSTMHDLVGTSAEELALTKGPEYNVKNDGESRADTKIDDQLVRRQKILDDSSNRLKETIKELSNQTETKDNVAKIAEYTKQLQAQNLEFKKTANQLNVRSSEKFKDISGDISDIDDTIKIHNKFINNQKKLLSKNILQGGLKFGAERNVEYRLNQISKLLVAKRNHNESLKTMENYSRIVSPTPTPTPVKSKDKADGTTAVPKSDDKKVKGQGTNLGQTPTTNNKTEIINKTVNNTVKKVEENNKLANGTPVVKSQSNKVEQTTVPNKVAKTNVNKQSLNKVVKSQSNKVEQTVIPKNAENVNKLAKLAVPKNADKTNVKASQANLAKNKQDEKQAAEKQDEQRRLLAQQEAEKQAAEKQDEQRRLLAQQEAQQKSNSALNDISNKPFTSDNDLLVSIVNQLKINNKTHQYSTDLITSALASKTYG